MRGVFVLAVALGLTGCAAIQSYERSEQPTGRVLKTYVGGPVLRIQRNGDLPNAWGKADLFGGKVDRGFTEVRYQGLDPNGRALFRVTEVTVTSTETTMSRYGHSQANFYANGTGSSVYGTVTFYEPPKGSAEALPANTSQFTVDPKRVKDFGVGAFHVQLVDVAESSVSYIVMKNNVD